MEVEKLNNAEKLNTWYREGKVSAAHSKFTEGYMAGMDDPGMTTATLPDKIEVPYEEGSEDAMNYEAGYISAIV